MAVRVPHLPIIFFKCFKQFVLSACIERHVQYSVQCVLVRASEFCNQASEFCSLLARWPSEVFWGNIQFTLVLHSKLKIPNKIVELKAAFQLI